MRVIIVGSRTIADFTTVVQAVTNSGFTITEVISGGAIGVDVLGEQWARHNNIHYIRYLPNWKKDGKGAGILRNAVMANNADALIAVWDGKSSGTADMIKRAYDKGLKVYIYTVQLDPLF